MKMSAIVDEWSSSQTYADALRNAIWSIPVGDARVSLDSERQFLTDVYTANFSLTHPSVAPYLNPQMRNLLERIVAGDVQPELLLVQDYLDRLAPFSDSLLVSSVWDAPPPPPPPPPLPPAPIPEVEDYFSNSRLYLNDAGDLEYEDGTPYRPESGRVPVDDGWTDAALGLATDALANAIWERLGYDTLGNLLDVTEQFENAANVANALEEIHRSAHDSLGMLMSDGSTLTGTEIEDRIDETLWVAQREASELARETLEGNNIPPFAYATLDLANETLTAPTEVWTEEGVYEIPYSGQSIWEFLVEAYAGGVQLGIFPELTPEPDPEDLRLQSWQADPESRSPVSFAFIPSLLGLQTHPSLMGFEPGAQVFAVGSIFDDRLTLSGLGPVFAATGDGDDSVRGGEQEDQLLGGRGHDELVGGNESDGLFGGIGNDTIWGGSSYEASGAAYADTVYGGSHNDLIFGDDDNDSLMGDGSSDTVYGGLGDDFIDGGSSADTLSGDEGADSILGGSNADLVYGATENDSIRGGTSDDTVYGGSHNDLIHGEDGDDSLYGEGSSDTIHGGAGDDGIDGGGSADVLFGDAGADSILGGSNADRIEGGTERDTIRGGTSDDTAYGGSHEDRIYGDSGDDSLYGDGSSDTLYGGDGEDLVEGGGSADRLYGGSNSDTLIGGSNNDTLYGGASSDTVTGGTGKDVFVFSTGIGSSVDAITDFSVPDDTIWLEDHVFDGLSAGALAAAAFVANTSGQAGTASHRLIYESDTGALFFDADGSGAGARVQFATLSIGLALTEADFLVV